MDRINPTILIDIRGIRPPCAAAGGSARADGLGPASPGRVRGIRNSTSGSRVPRLRRGALDEPVPDAWTERADLGAVSQPILGLHGADDTVSPLSAVRAWYATATRAELISISDGRHDVLNDLTHRTVAATIVLFLERLRQGPELPRIAIHERIDRVPAADPARA